MPLVQQLHEKYTDKGIKIVTINIGGSPAGIGKFMADNKYTFVALTDPQGSSSHDYSIQYVPTSFFIDKDGIIQDKVIGGFENLAQIEQKLTKIMTQPD
jgi:hypothetical protein